ARPLLCGHPDRGRPAAAVLGFAIGTMPRNGTRTRRARHALHALGVDDHARPRPSARRAWRNFAFALHADPEIPDLTRTGQAAAMSWKALAAGLLRPLPPRGRGPAQPGALHPQQSRPRRTGGTARGLSLQLVHLGQGTLAAPFYPVEPTHGRLSFLPTTKADHGSALQFVQEGYPEGFGEDGLDRDGMEARGGERGGLDRVLFGH